MDHAIETPRHVLRRNLLGGAVAWMLLTFVQIVLISTGKPGEAVFIMALETCVIPFIGWMTYLQARRAWNGEPHNDMDIRKPATFCTLAFPFVIGLLLISGGL